MIIIAAPLEPQSVCLLINVLRIKRANNYWITMDILPHVPVTPVPLITGKMKYAVKTLRYITFYDQIRRYSSVDHKPG